ncbi:membrane dipeptidase [Alcaligenes endophyticus]|uniref:Dipeptidase n=1 Tax=Alcaligenes endophyticus TaxID=1929088 RepID=A0ABT8EFH6_9BURK|nr:membrane dipeptidase [Alcaligenes endophyticus]MCX5590306.1 membrane dipeptidase [Alcaligenes endophyticus]MDN4120030.1 dipeptidase [Alcaligenes endophyticus]
MTTYADETLALHHSSFIFDGLSLFYTLTEPYSENILKAGVNAMNVTFAADEDWDTTLRNLERGLNQIEASPYLKLAVTTQDIWQAKAENKVAVIPGTQGSRMLEHRMENLDVLFRYGVRFFGLAYTGATLFGDGCGERRDAGVSSYGHELIDAVNELPMMLDLSHCGHSTRLQAAQRARAPVCTHSNSYTVNPNDRNTHDETALLIAQKGGVMGMCCLPKSVSPVAPSLETLLEHQDHYLALIGDEHIGLGLDFTEGLKSTGKPFSAGSVRWRTLRPDIFGTVDEFFTMPYPAGLAGIADLPNYTQALIDRGYTHDQIKGFLGGNWLRAFEKFIG